MLLTIVWVLVSLATVPLTLMAGTDQIAFGAAPTVLPLVAGRGSLSWASRRLSEWGPATRTLLAATATRRMTGNMDSPEAVSRGTESPGHESPGADAPRSGLGRVLPYLPIAIGVLVGGVVGFLVGTEYGQATDVGGLTGALAIFEVGIVAVGCLALLLVGWIFLRFLPRIPLGRAMMAGAAGLAAGTFIGAILGPAYLPQMEVAGRLTIVLDEPAVTLEGDATCWTAPNTRTIALVVADPVGEAGGHRLSAAVQRESSDDVVDVELAQNAADGGEPPRYVGQLAPLEIHVDDDWGRGSFRFQGLAISKTSVMPGEPDPGPFVGVDWPLSLNGRVEWTCDEVPG